MDCVIRNLSDGGAKLEVAAVRGIPDHFDLLVPGHRPQHCRIAWRALKEMGVQFLHSAPGAVQLQFIARLLEIAWGATLGRVRWSIGAL